MSEQQPQQQPWTRPPAETPAAVAPDAGAQQDAPAAAAPATGPAVGAATAGPVPVPAEAAPAPQAPASPYLGPAFRMPAYAAPGYVPGGYPMAPNVTTPQPADAATLSHRRLRAVAVSGWAAAAVAAAVAVAVAVNDGQPTETSAVTQVPSGSSPSSDTGTGSSGSEGSSSATDPGSSDGTAPGQGGWGFPGRGGFGDGSGSSGSSTSSDATAATAAQQTGVVTIDATLEYENATSAGTGMILSADGLVLTNNHVIDGATAIQVTDESTGKQYTATVVGTDASSDVALLQLEDASGLTPVTLDDDGGVSDGDGVTAVGNAEGTGDLVAAAGSVTDTDQTMTAQTETGGEAETLDGLIEFQAAVVSGDSGGPLLDADGEVVGMTTAASSGSATTIAYAITIQDALAVVSQIESGSTADGITIGYPAFLGVAFSSQSSAGFGGFGSSGTGTTTSGATIAGVIAGSPAESAGLVAGDTITAVDGAAVESSDALSSALDAYQPGDSVTITWVSGTTGASSSATVTLIAGPAD